MAVEKTRLLICLVCNTIDPLPDYEGDPDHDDTLIYTLARHVFPSGEPHKGHLADVETKYWNDPQIRRSIESSISEATGRTGLDQDFYNVRSTFGEDAMTCWKQHNRTNDCPDYKSEKKLLQPPTVRDRKSEGLQPFKSNTYLCDFCPVKSIVQGKVFKQRGLYK